MTKLQILEIPISGMDCAECAQYVQHTIEKLPGVHSVLVFLATEKAIVRLDSDQTGLPDLRAAVRTAGYDLPASDSPPTAPVSMYGFNRRLTLLLVGVCAFILRAVVFGEFLGWFDFLNERVPFALGLALVLAGGYPVFMNVLRSQSPITNLHRRQNHSHHQTPSGNLAPPRRIETDHPALLRDARIQDGRADGHPQASQRVFAR